MTAIIQVALGGAIGASARYLVGLGLTRLWGAGFPWATLAVNIAGSFAMGVLAVLLTPAGRFSPLLMSGVLGGFTTFSAFSLDAIALYERGQAGLAALYVLASVTLSIAALGAGMALARGVT